MPLTRKPKLTLALVKSRAADIRTNGDPGAHAADDELRTDVLRFIVRTSTDAASRAYARAALATEGIERWYA